jgi:hypothetical protein
MKTIGIAVAISSIVAAGACSHSSETPPPRSAQMAQASPESTPRPEHPMQGPAGGTPPNSWSSPVSPSIGGGPRPSPSERDVRDGNDGLAPDPTLGETDADQGLTERIRASLQADENLSPAAKNVDIVTISGKVTLRGTVKNQAERKTVENKARDVAGAADIENLLQVNKEKHR